MTRLHRSRARPSARVAAVAAGLAGLLLVRGAAPLPAQAPLAMQSHRREEPRRPDYPFVVGERMSYNVHFSAFKVGTGTMEVLGVTDVRGRLAFHTQFRVRGGTPFYRVDDTFQSWFAIDDFASLRFHQDQNEGRRERERRYEIYPERGVYDDLADAKGEQPSIAAPLDEGSFLYFVRTVPLEVGKTYTFNRYFKPDRNPVTIKVVRRERVKVPAGTFDAVVIQPVIKTKGLFSEGGQAEIWLSDDDRRMLLQMKSKLSIGSLSLHLKSFQLPSTTARIDNKPKGPGE